MTVQTMRGLGREIVTAYEDRTGALTKLQASTQAEIHRFGRDRARAARQQHSHLVRGQQELAARVTAQLRQQHEDHAAMAHAQRSHLARGQQELAARVTALLRQQHKDHAAMASQQRTRLASDRTRLQTATHVLLDKMHAGSVALRDEWRSITTRMQAKRASRAKRPAVPQAETRPAAASRTGDGSDPDSFQQRTIAHLARHPEGTRLADLEDQFLATRLQMARVVRGLISEGKVKKRDLLYFAA